MNTYMYMCIYYTYLFSTVIQAQANFRVDQDHSQVVSSWKQSNDQPCNAKALWKSTRVHLYVTETHWQWFHIDLPTNPFWPASRLYAPTSPPGTRVFSHSYSTICACLLISSPTLHNLSVYKLYFIISHHLTWRYSYCVKSNITKNNSTIWHDVYYEELHSN